MSIASSLSWSILTFNNLYASDFTFDSGAIESTTFTLIAQPLTPQWFAFQPTLRNTQYNGVQVNFNKPILSCDLVVSGGTVTSKIINGSGNLEFNILTTSLDITYTFNNIIATDGGRNNGLTLITGPVVTLTQSSSTTIGSNNVLIQNAAQTFKFTFNKAITGNPTITLNSGTGTYLSRTTDNLTLTYNLTNITSSSTTITFGTISGSDGTTTNDLIMYINPVPVLTFDFISDVLSPSVARDVNYDVGITYDLYFKFKDQTLNSDFSDVAITISGGGADIGDITQVHNSSSYKFTLTPTTTGNDKQLTITNVRDVNGFIYPSILSLSNLKFKYLILPPVPTTSGTIAVSYGSKLNYAYGDNLVTDGSKWTWNFYTKVPTMYNPSYYATGGFFGGISWQVRETNVWIRGGGDWEMPPANQNWDFSSPRRITVTRFNNNISCLLYTSPSPRDRQKSRMPSSA